MRFCLLLIVLIFSSSLQAQILFEEGKDAKTLFTDRGGLRWSTEDSIFILQLRFRMQNRFSYTTRSLKDLKQESSQLLVRRLRLRFNGIIGSPRLFYAIQFGFTIEDMDGDLNKLSNIIRDAMVEYKISEKIFVGFGQGKLPGNRERVISSGDLQMVDRSLMNRTFNIDRDFGAFFRYREGKNRTRTNITAVISSGNGRNVTTNPEGLCYTTRIEFLPFGDFTFLGDYFQGDLVREPKPRLSMALSQSFNRNAIRTGAQIGPIMSEMKDIQTFFADFIFKYRGFACMGEFVSRRAEGTPISFNSLGIPVFVYNGYGFNGQLSYCTPKNWELVSRYSKVEPRGVVHYFTQPRSELALGLNKYLRMHRVKIQGDISLLSELGNMYYQGRDHWGFRFQVEVGI